MKQFMMSVVAAMAMGVMAETANTVKVTKFHRLYPYSGKATVNYTVGGRTLPANATAEITLNTDDASATFVQSNIVTGANTFMIDFASSFGGALLLTNASFVVTIAQLGGVQLWENGPYWAECNVGATRPEEYGYYFWWGGTVGYTNTGSGWISVKDGTGISFDKYSSSADSTYWMDNSALLSAGYIDSTGNLVAAHDAATAHLGSPWRMPTADEIDALIDNCMYYHMDHHQRRVWATDDGQGDLCEQEHFPSGRRQRIRLLGPLQPRLARLLLVLYAAFGQFEQRVEPLLQFEQLPQGLQQPLQRAFYSSSSRIR